MLKAARNAARLSREEAAHRIYIGTRTLADYETGRTVAPPDVVMRMAEVYQEPALTADYCAKVCPIGQVLAHTVNKTEFATTVVRILKEFTDVKGLLDNLICIAANGQVDPHEEAEFAAIVREMIDLERQIGELKFFALRQGVEIEDIMPAAAV